MEFCFHSTSLMQAVHVHLVKVFRLFWLTMNVNPYLVDLPFVYIPRIHNYQQTIPTYLQQPQVLILMHIVSVKLRLLFHLQHHFYYIHSQIKPALHWKYQAPSSSDQICLHHCQAFLHENQLLLLLLVYLHKVPTLLPSLLSNIPLAVLPV